MKKFFALFCLTTFLVSCEKDVSSLSVTAWNVQTFFDGETSGREYSQFKNSQWTREKYATRVTGLSRCLLELDSDLVVLTEVENENVIRDIQNAFPFGKGYDYAAFGGEKNGIFGAAIFSRYPILALRPHQVDLSRALGEKQPSMRPLVEAEIHLGRTKITVLACHWKSKSGGEEESRIWRSAQRALLAEVTANLFDDENFSADFSAGNRAVLALGDFNMDFDEFGGEDGFVDFVSRDKTAVFYNPWITLEEKGSYYFDDSWEKIDHFFLFTGFGDGGEGFFTLEDFAVAEGDSFVDKKGIPRRYVVHTGGGLSDHLPISVRLQSVR